MVQDQLVDYISSQMKVGVTRDAVKASLIGAGWQAADVEDTLKKIEGAKMALPAVAAPSSKATSVFPATGMSSKANDPQMIRVSDLISAPDSAPASASVKSSGAASSSASASAKAPAKTNAPSSFTSMPAKAKPSGAGIANSIGGGGMGWKIATIASLVIFGGLAGFFYMQNTNLAGKVASLSTTSADVTSNIASLNSQVSALNSSNTALTAGMAALSVQNAQLSLELSFYAVPPGGATSTIGPVMLTGTLAGGGKMPYIITTSHGTKVYVQNSKDAKVIAALAPHMGTSVQISGTYLQGSQNISITAVNGTPI